MSTNCLLGLLLTFWTNCGMGTHVPFQDSGNFQPHLYFLPRVDDYVTLQIVWSTKWLFTLRANVGLHSTVGSHLFFSGFQPHQKKLSHLCNFFPLWVIIWPFRFYAWPKTNYILSKCGVSLRVCFLRFSTWRDGFPHSEQLWFPYSLWMSVSLAICMSSFKSYPTLSMVTFLWSTVYNFSSSEMNRTLKKYTVGKSLSHSIRTPGCFDVVKNNFRPPPHHMLAARHLHLKI